MWMSGIVRCTTASAAISIEHGARAALARGGERAGKLNPFSLGLGAVLLLVISVIACTAPMVRATGVDAVIAVPTE